MVLCGHFQVFDSNVSFLVSRGKKAMFAIVKETVKEFPDWLSKAVSYISSASFLAMLFCILG